MIADPYERRDPRALRTLHAVLRPLLLRRTKAMRDIDGACIGALPPATVLVVRVSLDDEERAFYDALYDRSKRQVNKGGGAPARTRRRRKRG